MQLYSDRIVESQIHSFEIGPEFIVIKYKSGGMLRIFSYKNHGKHHVEMLKLMARKGSGLEEYIQENSEALGLV